MKLRESTLNNNLDAIGKVYEQLANDIKESKLPDWVEVIQSRNNIPNLLIKNGANISPAYDMDNPRKKSKELAKIFQLHDEDVTIIVGCGIGYIVKSLLGKAEKNHHIIVIEPVLSLLKLFLSYYNFENELLNGTLILCTNTDDISYVMSIMEARQSKENYILIYEDYAVGRLEYKEIGMFASEIINQIRCNIGTVMGNGFMIANNDITGFPYYIKHRGVAELKDLFKGKPGVLVSTGPSLQKNIHVLKELQDKAVIVSVAQALRILLAYDINPDFIGTVDFGEVNHGHFNGLMTSQVPMVFLNRCYSRIFKEYQGPKFVAGSGNNEDVNKIFKMIDEKGLLPSGGSVSHFCFGLLVHLGCNPIIMMGQDLSYPGNQSHFNQVDEGGEISIKNGLIEWQITDHRSKLLENKKECLLSMGDVSYIEGYYKDPVLTNMGLRSFKTAFENMIKTYNLIEETKDRQFINSTEGGCHIVGTKRMSLRKALEEHKENIDKSIIKPYLSLDPNGDKLIKEAIPALKEDIKNLNIIERNASLALKITKIIDVHSNPKRIQELLEENEKYSKKAEETSKRNPLMNLYIYAEQREIQSRRFHTDNSKKEFLLKKKGKNALLTRKERNILILEAAKNASKKLRKLYKEALELLEKYNETKDMSLLTSKLDEPVDFSDAEKYFERGNFAHPLLDARRILYGKFIVDSLCLHRLKAHTLDEFKIARPIEEKALSMRNKLIKEAKESETDDTDKLLQFNELIEESRKIGREELYKHFVDRSYVPDLSRTVPLIEKAHNLFPENGEALWGMATSKGQEKNYKESVRYYSKLIKVNGDNLRYQFEKEIHKLNWTTDNKMTKKMKHGLFISAIKTIYSLMDKTTEFDSFLITIGDLYSEAKMYKEAEKAYSRYIKKFKHDYTAYEKKGFCLEQLGRTKQARKLYEKAKKIKG